MSAGSCHAVPRQLAAQPGPTIVQAEDVVAHAQRTRRHLPAAAEAAAGLGPRRSSWARAGRQGDAAQHLPAQL